MPAKIKKDILIAALQSELKEATFLLTEKDISLEALAAELKAAKYLLAEKDLSLEKERSHVGIIEKHCAELVDEVVRLRGELIELLEVSTKLRIAEEGLRAETGANGKLTLQLRLVEERGMGKAEGLRQALREVLDRIDPR